MNQREENEETHNSTSFGTHKIVLSRRPLRNSERCCDMVDAKKTQVMGNCLQDRKGKKMDQLTNKKWNVIGALSCYRPCRICSLVLHIHHNYQAWNEHFLPKIPRCNSSWFFLTMPDAVIVIAFFFVLFFFFSSCSWWICIFHLFGDVFIRSGKKESRNGEHGEKGHWTNLRTQKKKHEHWAIPH